MDGRRPKTPRVRKAAQAPLGLWVLAGIVVGAASLAAWPLVSPWFNQKAVDGRQVSAEEFRKCTRVLELAEKQNLIFAYSNGRWLKVDERRWQALAPADRRGILIAQHCSNFGSYYPTRSDESIGAFGARTGQRLTMLEP